MGKDIRLTRQVVAAVARAKKYIDDHPLHNKTTNELAEIAGVSRNGLQKAFKQLHGTHIKEYSTLRMMESARWMLEEGMAIGQVARHCRYRSHSAFTTAFKNMFGITPLAWLKDRE
jgi:AraC-like DNA-binding protein